MKNMFKTNILGLYDAYDKIRESDKQIKALQQAEDKLDDLSEAQDQSLVTRLMFKEQATKVYQDTGIQQATRINQAITTITPKMEAVKKALKDRTSTVATLFKDNAGLNLLPRLEKMSALLTAEYPSIQTMLECIAEKTPVEAAVPADLTCSKISSMLLDVNILQACLNKNVEQLSIAKLERKTTNMFTQCAAYRYTEETEQLVESTDKAASEVFSSVAMQELIEQYVALCQEFCSKVTID